MSVLLVGNETVYETTGHHEINWGTGVPGACQYTALKSGTLEEIIFHTGETTASTCTKLFIGIYAEGSSKPTGVPLAKGEFVGTPAKSANVTISGLSTKIVEGTKYWLAWLATGGAVNMITSVGTGGTTLIEDGTAKTSLAEETWSGTAAVGPATIYAKGTLLLGVSLYPPKFTPMIFQPSSINKAFPLAQEARKKEEQKLLSMLI